VTEFIAIESCCQDIRLCAVRFNSLHRQWPSILGFHSRENCADLPIVSVLSAIVPGLSANCK
jgi:hypothetical protein